MLESLGVPAADVALLGAGLMLGGSYWHRYRVRPEAKPAVSPRPPIERVWTDRIGGDSGGCLPGSYLADIRAVPNGTSAVIRLVGGKQHTGSAVGARDLIASAYAAALGITDDRIEVEPPLSRLTSEARLLILDRNPLHEVQRWSGPSLSLASGGRAVCARYGDQGAADMEWFELGSGARNWIIAGVPGSGKTSLVVWALAESVHARFVDAEGQSRPLVATVYVDGKNGQSIPEATDSPGISWAATWPQECARAVLCVEQAMYARQRYIGRLPWTDPQGRERRGMSWFDPIVTGLPILQLVIEEWPAIAQAYPWLVPVVLNIAKLGRSLGIRVVLVAQSITGSELGDPELRNMLGGNAAAFRTNDNHTGNLAFAGALEVNPSSLPVDMPGACYVKGPAGRAAMARGLLVDDPFGALNECPPWELHPVDLDGLGEGLALAQARREVWETRGEDPEAIPEVWAPILAAHRGQPVATVLAELLGDPGVASTPGAAPAAVGPEDVSPLRALVLDAIPSGQDVARADIVQAGEAAGWSERSVGKMLAGLVDDNVLTRPRKGVYRRAETPAQEGETAAA